jgi:transposase
VIKLGVDVHQACYVVAVQEDHATPKPARRFAPAEFLSWVESLLRAGHRVYVIYEACGFGFGLCRALEKTGATCYVIAPRKLDERGKGVKTDALDAAALCQRLSRYVDGNTRELALIRIPSEEEEKLRHVPRQREALVRARSKLQARAAACSFSTATGRRPAGGAAALGGSCKRSCRSGSRAAGGLPPGPERARCADRRPTKELETAAPKGLPSGLGQLTSEVLQREVCCWNRFRNGRQVGSYTGLCPGEYSSGQKRAVGSVTRHGNPRVRAALVKSAWRLVRDQPQYPPVQKRLPILARGAKATGSARKKAIVAGARHLAEDLWRLATGRCTAAQLGLRVETGDLLSHHGAGSGGTKAHAA